jgi:hypothetical protein
MLTIIVIILSTMNNKHNSTLPGYNENPGGFIMGITTKETDKYQKYIDSFTKCAQACYECFNARLNGEDAVCDKRCVKMLVECAKMCETAAFIMSMDGKFVKRQCELVAEACTVCAEECARYKDESCRKCAGVCRECAGDCREMLDKD